MSKITRQKLKAKTRAQLTALFNQASQNLSGLGRPSPARDDTLAALTMIRLELACRGLSP